MGTSNITIEKTHRVGEKSNDKGRAIVVSSIRFIKIK